MPEYVDLRPGQITPWPDLNPRKHFPVERIRELAVSIAEQGVLQNLIVQDAAATADGLYHIIAGETRWRAARLAEEGCSEIDLDPVKEVLIPCRVLTMSEGEALKLAMIENEQRGNLNAIEQARGFARLMALNNWTQGRCAEEILSDANRQPFVANRLRLLELPEDFTALIEDGHLQPTLARDNVLPLLRLEDEQPRHALDRLLTAIRDRQEAGQPIDGPWLSVTAKEITTEVGREFGNPTLFGAQDEGGADEETPAEGNEEVPNAPQEPTATAEEPPPAPAADPAPLPTATAPAPETPKAAPPAAPAPARAAPAPAAAPPAAAPVATLAPPGTKRDAVPEGAGLITAVMAATSRRPVTIALTPLPDGRIAATVAPKIAKANESPLALIASAEELDATLVGAIDTHFTS